MHPQPLVGDPPAKLLLDMCDGAMVPESGQREWGELLRRLGGEYRAIAALAHAHEEQCMQAMGVAEQDENVVVITEFEEDEP